MSSSPTINVRPSAPTLNEIDANARVPRRRNELSDSESEDERSRGDEAVPDNEEVLNRIFWTFRLQRNGNDEEIMNRIVEILRESPRLAAIRFQHQPYSSSATVPVNPHTTSHSGIRLLPFTYLLIGGAPLEILREIEEMAPPTEEFKYTEKMPDGRKHELIQTACHHRSHDTELIRHFAIVDQRHLTTSSANISMPIHIALNKYAPVETIRVLLDLCPESLTSRDDNTRLNCLERALWHRSPASPEIIDLLVERLKTTNPNSKLLFHNSQMVVTDAAAQRFLELLPTLRTFLCHVGTWEARAWINFLQNIPGDSTVDHMYLEVPLNLTPDEVAQVLRTLSIFVSTTDLRTLRLGNERHPVFGRTHDNDSLFLQSVTLGLQSQNHIHCLHLSAFDASIAEFGNLVLASHAPSQLSAISFNFTDGPWAPSTAKLRACKIKHLHFEHGKMPPETMCKILAVLPEMVNLVSFRTNMKVGSWELLIPPLADLIRRSKLRNLEMRDEGDRVHMRHDMHNLYPLYEALQENSTLLEYTVVPNCPIVGDSYLLANVLRDFNTTLRHINICWEGVSQMEDTDRLEYFLALNRLGRRKVRNVELSLAEFLTLIAKANQEENYPDNPGYVLLRDCPGLWSSPSQESKKRKREE